MKFFLSAVLFLTTASAAWANQHYGHGQGQGPNRQGQGQGQRPGTQSTRALTFEQFRDSCQNPRRYQNQRPPRNIKVICNDIRTVWREGRSTVYNVDSYRKVKTELISDKYVVKPEESWVFNAPTQTKCPVLKEVEQSLSIEHSITCDDVADEEVTLLSLCKDQITRTLGENGDLVEIRETGRTYAMCRTGNTGQQGPRRQRQGQDQGK